MIGCAPQTPLRIAATQVETSLPMFCSTHPKLQHVSVKEGAANEAPRLSKKAVRETGLSYLECLGSPPRWNPCYRRAGF
jgi:hypothetical protein